MRTNLKVKRQRYLGKATAIKDVEDALKRINFPRYSEKVVKRVAAEVEIHDRIRAKSLAAAASYVLH